jgi:hypothetical protein
MQWKFELLIKPPAVPLTEGPYMTALFVTATQGHFFQAQTDRVGWAMYP